MGYEIVKINDNTWRVEDEHIVRFFILTGSEKALLIDSGMTVNNAKDIAEDITGLPVMLINTHADKDHMGSNDQFDKFYMHPEEETNYYECQKLSGEYTPIVEGDVIDLGGRPLGIIELPGHTPGSIGLIDVNARVLYSGDTVQDDNIFMFGSQRNLETYRQSLRKLAGLKNRFDIIYPSHGSFPVEVDLIEKLYEVSGRLLDGEFPVTEMDFFGTTVNCVDTGVTKFLLDKK